MPLARINRPATRPDGQVIAHIVALNINRRHLKNGQRAMVLAMLDPEPEKGGRGKPSRKNDGLSALGEIGRGRAKNLISQARTVLRHSRANAEAVRDGIMHLDLAYQEAIKARQEDQGDAAKLARLRSLVPDVAAMVEDIRENGQRYAITITDDGVLIDGRMRLAACDQADVEPWYEFLNGEDPVAFIWSVNTKRRQMIKGQMAMVAVKQQIDQEEARSEDVIDHSSEAQSDDAIDYLLAAKQAGVSDARIRQAVAVARYAPHLVQQVIDGSVKLDDAYPKAIANKKEQEAIEGGIELLRTEDTDLAQKVDDREISLEEARAIVERRKAELAAAEAEVAGNGLRRAYRRRQAWRRELGRPEAQAACGALPGCLAAGAARGARRCSMNDAPAGRA